MWLARFGRTVADHLTGAVTDRVWVWGLMGYGSGEMTIVQAANDATGQPERVTQTDLSMRLAALGGRGALLSRPTRAAAWASRSKPAAGS